jgi:hexokinase
MPTDLKSQIEKLEELFLVPTTKLKEISDHFVQELERGLSKEGGTIVRHAPCSEERKTLTKTAHDTHLVHGLPRWPRDRQLSCA